MSKKTSASKKANYAAYQAKSTAAKNKTAKLVRHLKKHPNDAQSASNAPSRCAGKHNHTPRTQFEARVRRSLKTGAFGPGYSAKPVQKHVQKSITLNDLFQSEAV